MEEAMQKQAEKDGKGGSPRDSKSPMIRKPKKKKKVRKLPEHLGGPPQQDGERAIFHRERPVAEPNIH